MREARRTVLVAGVLGQCAAWVAGVLPWPLLPVTAVLLVLASRVSGGAAGPLGEGSAGRWGGPVGEQRLRRVATGFALLCSLVALPRILSPQEDGLREVLGPLLVAVQLAQALTWRQRRDLQTGLAVAAGLLVLGASFAPDVLVGLPLLLGWAACVLALVLLHAARLRQDVDEVVAAARPPLAAVTALALACGLVAFLLVPTPTTPRAGSRLAASSADPGASARAGVFTSGRVDLRTRGSLSDRVLAQVPEDSPQLWRSASYPSWDGTSWTARSTLPQRLPNMVDVPGSRTDAVQLRGARGTVWSPGLPLAVLPDGGFGAVARGGGVTLSREAPGYEVTSTPQPTDGAGLTDGPLDAAYLQLPASLPQRVAALALEITASAPTTAAKVTAVERWLATHARYRLDSPVPAPDEDAVDRFLFVDRVGFCEQFAAAEVVLLRAVGIGARFVVGLAYGAAVGGGHRDFREKDLHAWVEVSYAGGVWASSDPTAGAAQDVAAQTTARARLAAAVLRTLRRADEVPGGRPVLAALLLGLVTAGLLTRRRGRAATVSPVLDVPGSTAGGPALTVFLAWDRRLGPAARRPHESLAELRRRLDLPPRQASAVGVVEQECYAPDPPDPAALRSVTAALTPG